MSVFRSADLDADIRNWDREQADWEDSLPKCEQCHDTIDDFVWEFDDQTLCECCARKNYRRSVV